MSVSTLQFQISDMNTNTKIIVKLTYFEAEFEMEWATFQTPLQSKLVLTIIFYSWSHEQYIS